MVLLDYFDSVIDGIEFLIALGSIIGLLGAILGLILFIAGSSKYRLAYTKLLIISLILLGLCGGFGRGLKYFHVH